MTPEQTLLLQQTKDAVGACIVLLLVVLLLLVIKLVLEFVVSIMSYSALTETRSLLRIMRGWTDVIAMRRDAMESAVGEVKDTVQAGMVSVKREVTKAAEKAAAVVLAEKVATSGDSSDKFPRPPDIGG